MTENELAICELMDSIQERYFPELEGKLGYSVRKDDKIDGVHAQAKFGIMEIVLYYSDDRIVEPKFRLGLVPVISHEMAHYIDPVNPERVLEERLPKEMFGLWKALVNEGYASCSMARRDEG